MNCDRCHTTIGTPNNPWGHIVTRVTYRPPYETTVYKMCEPCIDFMLLEADINPELTLRLDIRTK